MCTVSEEEPRTPASMAGRQEEGEPSVTCRSVSGRRAIGSAWSGMDHSDKGILRVVMTSLKGVVCHWRSGMDRRGRPRAGETCE